jgi:bifunctional DNA-binding transcriptional regulator/antitoxin component of YhaV-PrlF toxin-antitoxin module
MPKEVRQTTLIARGQRSIVDRSSARRLVLVQKSERRSGVGPDRHRKKQREREVDRETQREKVRKAERWMERERER